MNNFMCVLVECHPGYSTLPTRADPNITLSAFNIFLAVHILHNTVGTICIAAICIGTMFNTNANNDKQKHLFHNIDNAVATLVVLCGVGSICVGTVMCCCCCVLCCNMFHAIYFYFCIGSCAWTC